MVANIFEQQIGNIRYVIEYNKLKKIKFPIYNSYIKSGLQIKSNRIAIMCVKFHLAADSKNNVFLNGELLCDKKRTGVKARSLVDIEDLCGSMIWAINKYSSKKSILYYPAIKTCADAVADSLYNYYIKKNDDVIIINHPYKHVSFLLTKANKVIGICENTVINESDKSIMHLTAKLHNMTGTYLSEIKKEKDKRVRVIVLNEDSGEKMLSIDGIINGSYNNDANITIDRINSSDIGLTECQNIYQQGNYKEYFLDKAKTEGDTFELFE